MFSFQRGRWLVVLLTVLVLNACRLDAPVERLTENPTDCVEDFDPAVDYFPRKAALRHAEVFTASYFSHYKVVEVVRPESGVRWTYLLVQCGTPRPPGFAGAEVIEIPVRRVVTTSTIELPHLSVLGVVESLVGHEHLQFAITPDVRRHIASGNVVQVGIEGTYGEFDHDKVLAAEADVVFATAARTQASKTPERLHAAGVTVVETPGFLEPTPLGRAEWIAFTALFFNREALAEEHLAPVEAEYQRLAGLARSARPRPAVLNGGIYEDGGPWWMASGEGYTARLITDAGGDYLGGGTLRVQARGFELEDVLPLAREADVWLHPGTFRSLAEIATYDPRLGELPVVRSGRIYKKDAWLSNPEKGEGAGTAFWEIGMSRPDLVLADMVEIFHPDLVPEYRLTFHRRLD